MKTSRVSTYLWAFLLALALLLSACKGASTPPVPAQPTSTLAPAPVTPTGGPHAADQPPGEPVTPAPAETSPPAEAPPPPPAVRSLPVFARFEPPAVSVAPAVVHEPIAPDLSNVRVPFILSDGLRQRLAENGFVVAPGTEKEFFTLYEKARYDNQPIFVTSDALLHVYHLLFDKVLRTAETEQFIPRLQALNQAMLKQADQVYQELKGGAWEDPARRLVAYFGVGSKLLDPTVNVPDYAADLVEAELELVNAAAGILPSPIFPGLEFGEDYTQYIPRGHYTRSEALKNYFKSMMWYGRMTFRLKARDPEVGKAETRAALLLTHVLKNANIGDHPALEAWDDLYAPTAFMVGRSDDLTPLQYMDLIAAIYGPQASASELVDEAKLGTFIEMANQLPPPRILGMVIMDEDNVEESTKGLRFMGQRFVPDAYAFRQLIYRNVGTRERPRGLPKGLDWFAALGSQRAYQHLEAMGETSYERYPEQMQKVRDWLSGLTQAEWTETLYNTWLYTFDPLIEEPGQGYPAFMRSAAWLDKQLNTVLGSWAELKHDTILYAKQVYAELGGGPPPPPPEPPRGYVEPVPEFYARLAALANMTRTGLDSRLLLNDLDRQSLDWLEQTALAFKVMAEKELRGEPLTEDEYHQIRFIGGTLEQLTMAAADSDMEDPTAPRFMEEEPQAAVIADVATNPNPPAQALEEAVGRVNPIYVVAPIVEPDGSVFLQVAKGGVFSYYEFPWPIEDRLTDEKWRAMLDDGSAPPVPEWTASFLVDEIEYQDLASAIFRFQQDLTNAYWYQQPDNIAEAGAEIKAMRDQITNWLAEKRYMGHQLMASEFRSFDLQSENQAVVTVRETWQDKLFAYTGDYPDQGYDEPPEAQRGPYTLDVTYSLERVKNEFGANWQVTNAAYANQPPEW